MVQGGDSEEIRRQYVFHFSPLPSIHFTTYKSPNPPSHRQRNTSGKIGNALKDSALIENTIPYTLAYYKTSDNGICQLTLPLLLTPRLGSSLSFSLFLFISSGGGYPPYLHHNHGTVLIMCISGHLLPTFDKQINTSPSLRLSSSEQRNLDIGDS